MTRTPRLTLGQFAGACLAATTVVLVVVLSIFYQGSRRTVLMAAEKLMSQAARRVTERVEAHLGEAELALESLERQSALGLLDADDPGAIEGALIAGLSSFPHVTEVTVTYARSVGVYESGDDRHDAGELRIEPGRSGQIAVSRSGAAGELLVRRTSDAGGRWSTEERRLPSERASHPASPPGVEPTLHATFTVASRPDLRGRAIWSDLSYRERDAALPENARSRVVSVQKALWAGERFLAVLRISLLSDRVDEIARAGIGDDAGGVDPHLVFLCDRSGRLISRLSDRDRFTLLDPDGKPDPDGDVRVEAASLPPEVAAALSSADMQEVRPGEAATERLTVGGVGYLVGVAALLGGRTQGWLVGVVVPEDYYLGDLEASRRRVFAGVAVLLLACGLGGAVALRSVRGDLGGLIGGITALRNFDFAPSAGRPAAFRDIQVATDSLEQAKTALRALGKYVPIGLVRQLYEARLEPTLGGKTRDVTLMFSDIAGFTTISERMSADELAVALGAYLEAMTQAIHASDGIVDKYIGDGVMAMWNAPVECADHPRRACEAALACREATAKLFASPKWSGLAPWTTRFGIHRAEVDVGHYGAPDRMSYTAMGDGVNLASRLESLNKQYGTGILVSAAVEAEARNAFRFRRIDRVAVKGRREGVAIYELLGRSDDASPASTPVDIADRYERALDEYWSRRFEAALALLEQNTDDAPSLVLAERCRGFLADPPPPDWDGTWVAAHK